MIIRFGCENYRSIKEYQEILFTTISNASDHKHFSFSVEGIREQLLPITAIYGANASGKTNMVRALRVLFNGICFGSNSSDRINIQQYRLEESCASKPSVFDIDFVCDSTHYHYGFSILEGVVEEEWLHKFSYVKRAAKTVLFERDSKKKDPYFFGKDLKGKNKVTSDITDDTALFLSVAAKSKHELLSKISNYFVQNYSFIFKTGNPEHRIAQTILDRGLEKEISEYLAMVDVGSPNVSVSEEKFDEERMNLQKSVQSFIKEKLPQRIVTDEIKEYDYKLDLTRVSEDGNTVHFSFDDESLGTKSYISLLSSALLVFKNGGVLVVDEIEASLHPFLVKQIVELFCNTKVNVAKAQLICTTHLVELLTAGVLPKSAVWLVGKDLTGASRVNPLTDYKIGNNSNLGRGYLKGRFGGIPHLQESLDLNN